MPLGDHLLPRQLPSWVMYGRLLANSVLLLLVDGLQVHRRGPCGPHFNWSEY